MPAPGHSVTSCEQRNLDERHVAREHEHRTDGRAARRPPRRARRAGPRPRRLRARRAESAHAGTDLDHRVAHLGRARARHVPRASRRATRSSPCRCPSAGSRRPVSRSAGNRFTSFTSVRSEYPTTSQPVARFSSSTRFCTLPSADVTLRDDDRGLPRRRRRRRRRPRAPTARARHLACAARFAAMNSARCIPSRSSSPGEVEQQVEVELVPRVLVRDRDVGRPRSRFEPERDPHHEQQREDDPERDPERHVSVVGWNPRTPA